MTDPLPMYQINHDREAQCETGGIHVECWPCRHYQRDHTGPHEWHHQCAILAKTFPRRCGRYEREPGSDDQVGDDDAPPSEVERFGVDLWAGIR